MENSDGPTRKMKIYSDPKYLYKGVSHTLMLYPFWGKPPEDPRRPDYGTFDRYTELGHRHFEMSSLADADIAVLPMSWQDIKNNADAIHLSHQFAAHVRDAGKQTAIFWWDDSEESIDVPQSVIFRTAFSRSTQKPNEHAVPIWSGDFITKYLNSELCLRQKQEKAIVGFCGAATPLPTPNQGNTLPLKSRLRTVADAIVRTKREQAPPPPLTGWQLRAQALDILDKSPLVDTNFLIRDSFFAGAWTAEGIVDFDSVHQARKVYVQNIIESDYILCARGGGNYSFRLYETLCCGRIPVFIDTDCVLPYSKQIDWKKYCVWVDQSELPFISEKVAEFHQNLTPQEFTDLQRDCRNLWEQWLSPEGFFANLYQYFK